MFKIKFNLNSSSLSAALKQKPLSLSRKQLALSQSVAQDMQASIKAALNIPVERKDGKLLRSSPGEAPRRQSGNLRESIETRVIKDGNQISLIAGDLKGKAPYALYLEYGSLSLEPRPFLLPALARYSEVLSQGLKTLAEEQ